MAVAKVFMIGRSQAIRPRKEFRAGADTVRLERTGEGFLVLTKEPWADGNRSDIFTLTRVTLS